MRLNTLAHQNKTQAFDFMRGVAVLLVLFTHLDNYQLLKIWPISYQPLQGFIGQTGVHLFFVISGYLIWASAQRLLNQPSGLIKYACHRLTRIYPVYLFSIGFIVITADWFIGNFKPEVSFSVVVRHLLFLQNFQPYINLSLNGPFWTLTLECIFYILVPIIYWLQPRTRLLLSSILLSQFLTHYVSGLHSFINYWCLFSAGILVQQHQKIPNKIASLFMLLTSALLCIAYPQFQIFSFIFAVMLFCLLLNNRFNSTLSKPIIGIGVISYSVYIWHAVLIHLIFPYVQTFNYLIPPIKPWFKYGIHLQGIIMIIIVILVSILSYLVLEKPGMTTCRDFLVKQLTRK